MCILVVLASHYSSILVQLYYYYRTCNNPHFTSTKHVLEYKKSLLPDENVKYATLRTKFEMIPHPNFASSLCVSPRAHAQIATHILLHKNAGPWLSTAHKLDPQCLHTCQKPCPHPYILREAARNIQANVFAAAESARRHRKIRSLGTSM
jgi:hypothetical protein